MPVFAQQQQRASFLHQQQQAASVLHQPATAEPSGSRGIGKAMMVGALLGGGSLKQMALGAAAHAMGNKMSMGTLAMAGIGHSMMSGLFQPASMMAYGFGNALDLAGPVLSPFSMSNFAYGAMVGYNPFDAMTGSLMSLPFHLAAR